MILNQFTLPSIPEASRNGKDYFTVCDMAGFADAASRIRPKWIENDRAWCGGMNHAESLACVRSGDLRAVPDSEKYLAAMESHVFVTRSHRVVNDVVGGMVDVPSMLAGIPCHMRRRVRVATEVAPLSVFVDLTSSANIPASSVYKRGCAILALVRLLANMRPVELWAMAASGPHNDSFAWFTLVRLDTAPLDLARAAHMLTHPSVPRALLYKVGYEHCGQHAGCWPYGNHDTLRKHGEAILRRAVTPGSDVLFIPSIHATDQAVQQPEQWLKDMLHRYGGNVVQNGE
jgi:hypothetical protein